MLFKRLWSNHRGFTVLWNSELNIESDIVLRSGLEAAICIAANFKLRDDFVCLMHRDAAATLQGQIKWHRDNADSETVRDFEATLRNLQARFPAGTKAAKLDWKSLAEQGGVPQLYGFHRMLSGVSSHVSGLSVLRGVTGEGMAELQVELRGLTRKIHLMMMAGATLKGSMLHAGMIEEDAQVEAALALTNRMNALSKSWPGVG